MVEEKTEKNFEKIQCPFCGGKLNLFIKKAVIDFTPSNANGKVRCLHCGQNVWFSVKNKNNQ